MFAIGRPIGTIGRSLARSQSQNVTSSAASVGPYRLCNPASNLLRNSSCKSKLKSGRIEYPSGIPPGITAAEIDRGDVLLCQAFPRSDLSIEARRVPVRIADAAICEIVALEPLPLRAVRVRLRYREGRLEARPGQFVDLRNHAGDTDRLAVIGVGTGVLELECADDGGVLRDWLSVHALAGAIVRVAGPFDRPR